MNNKKARKSVVIIEDPAGIKRPFGTFSEICDTYLFDYEKHKRKGLPLEIDGFQIYRLPFKEKHQMDLDRVGDVIVDVFSENIKVIGYEKCIRYKTYYSPEKKEWNLRVTLGSKNWVSYDSLPDCKEILKIINGTLGSTLRLDRSNVMEFDDRGTQISFYFKK